MGNPQNNSRLVRNGRSQGLGDSLHRHGHDLPDCGRRRSPRDAHSAHGSKRHRPLARSVRPALFHARHHHDFLVCLADFIGIFRLPDPADDRRPRCGLPAPEFIHLLVVSALRRSALYVSFFWPSAPRRVVCLRAVYADAVLAGHWHGCLRNGADFSDDLHHGERGQYDRHDSSDARPWHGHQPHASFRIQHADHVFDHYLCAARIDRGLHLS